MIDQNTTPEWQEVRGKHRSRTKPTTPATRTQPRRANQAEGQKRLWALRDALSSDEEGNSDSDVSDDGTTAQRRHRVQQRKRQAARRRRPSPRSPPPPTTESDEKSSTTTTTKSTNGKQQQVTPQKPAMPTKDDKKSDNDQHERTPPLGTRTPASLPARPAGSSPHHLRHVTNARAGPSSVPPSSIRLEIHHQMYTYKETVQKAPQPTRQTAHKRPTPPRARKRKIHHSAKHHSHADNGTQRKRHHQEYTSIGYTSINQPAQKA